MGIMTWQDVPIQDERASPYGLPNQINPVRGAATAFGLDVLNLAGTVKSLISQNFPVASMMPDGLFSEAAQVSAPLTQSQIDHVHSIYPDILIGKGASREQVEAAIDRRERENAGEYLNQHISPGFAGEAALFTGQLGASIANYPALKGAQWATKGIQMGSELLATHVANSAVTRLGGVASVKAQQLIADNAAKVGFFKGAAGFSAFTAIEEGMTQGAAVLSGVLTPNEQDYRIMDGVFSVASSGLVGGVLGLGAERLTGKLVDKKFVPDIKTIPKESDRFPGITQLYSADFGLGEVSEKIERAAEVVKAFFQSAKESSERETLDNVSQAFEAGKDANSDFIHEVNRHEAWQRLQGYIDQSGLTPDEFAESLATNRTALAGLFKTDKPDFDALLQMVMNESLIELAGKTEGDVIPSDPSKAAFLKSMNDNYVNFDEKSAPFMDVKDVETGEPSSILDKRLQAFSDEEIAGLAENKANYYAKRAIKRKRLLGFEQTLTDFITNFGEQISQEMESGIEISPEYLKSFFEYLSPDGLEGIEDLLDASKNDVDFMASHISQLLQDLPRDPETGELSFAPDKIQETIKREFQYIKAQVVRANRDAIAFDSKLRILQNATDHMTTRSGSGIREGMNALLDRSQFEFEGANTGTFRKQNIAEHYFKAQLTYELDQAKVMEFWNDPNSSTEITTAIYNHDMGLPNDNVSEAARKIAEIVNRFYDMAIDAYAKEGVIIPRLKGRIHYQWHNPYRILKLPFLERRRLTRTEAKDVSFDRWYEVIHDKIDLEKTFQTDVVFSDGEPTVDVNNPQELRAAFRSTFDKITERDFRREKSNILSRRSRRRVYQFKSPEAFAEYNRVFGAGDAQSSIIRELNGMFREVELVKDWGVEPEKMLADVMSHAESLPGWSEYVAHTAQTKETPARLMHMMRFGAAHTGTAFSEMIYNLKAYESVTKLGNLMFLNFSDSLTAANALNRFSIPMFESIAKGIQQTFSRYTPEQKADYQRMFNVSKQQYMGGYYRHFEDGTLSSKLSKMIRITMKLTGTENSEYSNRAMVGQSLSTWFAKNLKELDFADLDPLSQKTMARYDIGESEWNLYRKAVKKYKGTDYLGWDNIHEVSDADIATYLRQNGVKDITPDRIEIMRDDLAQRYRLLMQDQMDDALNRKSLIETDLLRFKRPTQTASAIDDVINGMMLFKTYGFMWMRRHVGDRIYGRGASGYRTSQIQGTADWHGLMKLMAYGFAMEYAIQQMKEIANTGKPLPFDGKTAFESLMGNLGPIAYVSRVEGDNFTSSIAKMIAGPIGGDIDRVARIVHQFEKGYWKGDYTNAQTNSIKFLASQFGGVPMLKPALNTLLFDNMIQNIKGRRTGHIIDNVASNQQGQ